MGNSAGRTDFEWVYTDQPHTQRRKEMLGEAPRPRSRCGAQPQAVWSPRPTRALGSFLPPAGMPCGLLSAGSCPPPPRPSVPAGS
ncbi:Sphingolipid delta(4)-desaturase/C4-monooxygenase DES2 [Galemys pyrenaicus]|uniref:Sphingolipid delta(4)-desaturase/C4-monooxygenase DES2 n=1 Tax=Galemys pyrenaicus TaxID=202257 RepID=A0A8J6A5Y5_GALPY|nr:Sphingolipid delta(4)-desaturase/C4-monooxygenase DES2 [Galemys pyrenaicus]